ncbi:MAG: TetR/AcrR family transcriptional regulator [Bacteroidales bacterium]|jgi:AcrR family transcriptional regulator
MPRKRNIKQKTVKVARGLFFLNGYTSVSIEDIIKKADISRKTLYHYFACKEDILNEVIDDLRDGLTAEINEVLAKPRIEFTEKLKIIFTNTAVTLSAISAKFSSNVRKTSPEAWNKITAYKREISQMCFSRLMDEGIEKGHISKDINKDVALLTFLIAVDNLFDPLFLDQLPKDLLGRIPRHPREIFDAIIKVIYEGILTQETREKYLEKAKK